MAMIGTIKEVSTVDGQHKAVIMSGFGPGVTATIMQSGAVDFQPLPGDRVLYHRVGQEIVVSAIFSEDATAAPGEWLVFSRTSDGVVKTVIHAKDDGVISLANAAGDFELKASGQFSVNGGNLTVDP